MLILALALAGCASVPDPINTPVGGPGIDQARADPDAAAGERIRWGGTISSVENLEDGSEIIVVGRAISRRGEPDPDTPSPGRFIAAVDRFVDPEVYEPGRRVTVVGTITRSRPGRIGDYVYDYPVVRTQTLYLWEKYVRRDRHRYDDWPYHFGPYYHPYDWPFHHRHWHRYGYWH